MSLSITAYGLDSDIIWCNKSKISHISALDVQYVCAGGEELERCLQITGLVQWGETMRFYGDMAKHIVGNWNN